MYSINSKIKANYRRAIKATKQQLIKVSLVISNTRGGDGDPFKIALGIVMTFVIGAMVLVLLVTLFGDTAIGGWLKNSVGNWFPTGGESRPTA